MGNLAFNDSIAFVEHNTLRISRSVVQERNELAPGTSPEPDHRRAGPAPHVGELPERPLRRFRRGCFVDGFQIGDDLEPDPQNVLWHTDRGVEGLQWTAHLRVHLVNNAVGDPVDRVLQDRRAVDPGEVGADLTGRQAFADNDRTIASMSGKRRWRFFTS
ncbi:hypothetical protein HD592_002330 [Schaalia hyovaginalis]|uniref:Uncharacterized protein n=1 Tax=Schaalia hyovaginalis TaxID=29316 RepID=A0A923E4F2_9ACTO|nr:hypothetical protein [Schaalia hyovaginalis]MBB6333463.1 hypothetical protein [Schaalia hyovaginalis]MBB6335754.1 hypothetical protein [Schaalia hyovaginalis]MBB6335765.1 hypothetical protein [Schaalia hyovaginalis]